MHDWSWPRLVAAHHDYDPLASLELLARLLAACPPDLPPLLRAELELRWRHALELDLLDSALRPSFSLHRRVDPTTGREEPRALLLDWEGLGEGRVRAVVAEAVQHARKRLFELDRADPRPVRTPAGARDPEAWVGARPSLYLDYAPGELAFALVAYNEWNRIRRPDDPDRRASSIEVDRRREALAPLAEAVRARQAGAMAELIAVVRVDADLDAERRALAGLLDRLVVGLPRLLHELERGRPPAPLMTDEGAAGTVRANALVAVYLTRTALQADQVYASSKQRVYRPRGLRADTIPLLEAWGYKGADKVLREGPKVARYEALEQTIQAALQPDEEEAA